MVCGTPVIANSRGSMGELIAHGVTGFLVDSIDSAVSRSLQRASLTGARSPNRPPTGFKDCTEGSDCITMRSV
jgi:glycosyltransferase involved in cell wall biosynthesis